MGKGGSRMAPSLDCLAGVVRWCGGHRRLDHPRSQDSLFPIRHLLTNTETESWVKWVVENFCQCVTRFRAACERLAAGSEHMRKRGAYVGVYCVLCNVLCVLYYIQQQPQQKPQWWGAASQLLLWWFKRCDTQRCHITAKRSSCASELFLITVSKIWVLYL